MTDVSSIFESKHDQDKPRDSEIRYRRLFETAQDGILILSAVTARIVQVNPFAIELLGYSREEFRGKELWEIGLLKDSDAARETLRELQQRGIIRYENLPLQTKDGKQRAVEFVGSLYDEDGYQFIQCNIRDITARKHAEESVRKFHDELISLVAELRRRDAEMQLLNRMHDLLQSCVTQEEAYRVIAMVGGELFFDQSGCLAVLSDSDRDLQAVACWGEDLVEPIFPIQDCWALRRGEFHGVKFPGTGLMCRHFVNQPETGYRCVPLTVQGETLGALCLVDGSEKVDKHQTNRRELALTVGEAIKMSLSNLKLREKLNDEVIHDPLTGLFNRRFLEEILARDLFRAQRRNSDLCVVMLDLDGFKQFNDVFGHDIGDLLLRDFGKVLRENLRKGDISCRYGGDEFVLVLVDSELADTQRRVEEICRLFKQTQLRWGNPRRTVTVSAGIAQAGIYNSNPGELLRAADKALYAAKESGRDRVMVQTTTA